MAREYFNAYHSYLKSMEPYNDAERGRLFTALLIYSSTGEAPKLRGNERYLFPTMREQIDRDCRAYREKCERQAQNARMRWHADACRGMPDNAGYAKEKEKEKEKEKAKAKAGMEESAPPFAQDRAQDSAQDRTQGGAQGRAWDAAQGGAQDGAQDGAPRANGSDWERAARGQADREPARSDREPAKPLAARPYPPREAPSNEAPRAEMPPRANGSDWERAARGQADREPAKPSAARPYPPREAPPDEAPRAEMPPRANGSDWERAARGQADREPAGEAVREAARAGRERPFRPPSLEEVAAYCRERGSTVDPKRFFNYYAANGWHIGRSKMRDWRRAVITWELKDRAAAQSARGDPNPFFGGGV